MSQEGKGSGKIPGGDSIKISLTAKGICSLPRKEKKNKQEEKPLGRSSETRERAHYGTDEGGGSPARKRSVGCGQDRSRFSIGEQQKKRKNSNAALGKGIENLLKRLNGPPLGFQVPESEDKEPGISQRNRDLWGERDRQELGALTRAGGGKRRLSFK